MIRILPLLLALATGCTTASTTSLRVLAAASLTEPMAELEAAFEADHPGVDVQVALAGTQALRLQVEQGAAADVFLSADPVHLTALAEAGLVDAPTVFATNEVVLIVPEGSPVRSVAQLDQVERLVVGAPTVPIGRYTAQVLDALGRTRGEALQAAVTSHIVSREASVRLVRAKVVLGEADGAFVYRTDAAGLDGVRLVELGELSVAATYPAARVTASDQPELADAFLAHLTGPAGRAVLADHGFGLP